jgi:hypothetical protein
MLRRTRLARLDGRAIASSKVIARPSAQAAAKPLRLSASKARLGATLPRSRITLLSQLKL